MRDGIRWGKGGGDGVTASDVKVGVCPDPACRCVHMILYDKNDRAFAQACLNVASVPSFIEGVRSAAYEIAATKES